MRHSKSMQIDTALADAFIFVPFGGFFWMVECLESLVHAFYTKISKLLFRCKCKSLETTIYYVLFVDNWGKVKSSI